MTTDTSGTAPERPAGTENETASSPAASGPQAPNAAGEQDVVAKELAEAKDRLLRTLAEMENLRRRTEREVVDARLYGIANFARDMLGIADNIHRALEAISPDFRDAAEGGVKALIEGVELTERELHKTLEKHSVRRFDPTGEKFDPNLHQAMYEIPDPATPAGMVAQVVQAGYMIGERVLRPALVGVSKGGPKTAPQTENAPGAQS